MKFVPFKELSPEACVFNAAFHFSLFLDFAYSVTFQSDFIYYAINCFWICAVEVRNAKLRNYLKWVCKGKRALKLEGKSL